MVEVQSIQFVIDTGAPATRIPPIILPNEKKETTKYFVEVNKKPINFKDEAMVEVKTEKGTEVFPILIMVSKDTQLFLGLNWLDKLEISQQGEKNTNIIRNMDNDERQENFWRIRKLIQKQPHDKVSNKRHSAEKKRH